jgi:hypothetical protein
MDTMVNRSMRRARRQSRIGIFLGLLCVLGGSSAALLAQFQMPDPKQMAGIPRPVTDLPSGTVSVRLIRGQLSNNITNFPVELHVGSEVRTAKTDDAGRAEFGSLPAGATIKAVAVVDGERLESQEFPAPTQGGIRLILVATDTSKGATADVGAAAVPGQVVIGGQTRIIVEPGDETVTVYYLLDVMNNARTPVNPQTAFTVDLPSGASSATILEGSSSKATAAGTKVQVAGPFPPGRTLVQAAFQLPGGSASLQIDQRFPATLEQLAVVVKKLGDTKLSSPQIARQQDMTSSGETFIAGTGGSVAAGQPISLTIENLPHHNAVPRWTALGLAGAIVVIGAWLARRPDDANARAAERKRLVARREKLFGDLVRLEHERRAGKIADGKYDARRESLLGALEHIYGALDSDDSGPEPADRPGLVA